jgi:hypothetical protein
MAMSFTLVTSCREALSGVVSTRLIREQEAEDRKTKAYEEVSDSSELSASEIYHRRNESEVVCRGRMVVSGREGSLNHPISSITNTIDQDWKGRTRWQDGPYVEKS